MFEKRSLCRNHHRPVNLLPYKPEADHLHHNGDGPGGWVGDEKGVERTVLWEDPEDPYDAMARRMVYHGLNGSAVRRIEAGIRHAKDVKADGAVWFGHWGCKHTLGAAQLAKKKFEEAGIPMLLLDGDGCDRSHGGEGQTSTRLGAFLEMLGAEEMEGGQDE